MTSKDSQVTSWT